MPIIKAFHSSGRWDRSPELLAVNIRRMRGRGRSLGTRTELSRADQSAELSWPDDGWGSYHPRDDQGRWNDCAIEWDHAVWRKVETYVVPLSDIQIHTVNGFPLPLSSMPCAVLQHRQTRRHVLLCVAHMQLANTELRRKAWFQEAASMNSHWRQVQAQHPGWHIVFQGDANRNQRQKVNRLLVNDHMALGVNRMQNLWSGHMPALGGTHGSRAILDLTLSTMPGGSRLLRDDASSDHRPYESWMTL